MQIVYLIKFIPTKQVTKLTNLHAYFTGRVFASAKDADSYAERENSGVSANYGQTVVVPTTLE